MSSSLGHGFIAESNIWILKAEKGSAIGASFQPQIRSNAKKHIPSTQRTLRRKSPMTPNTITLAKNLVIFFLMSHPVLYAASICQCGNFNNNFPPCPLALLLTRSLTHTATHSLHSLTHSLTHRQTERQTDRQTERQERQTDKQGENKSKRTMS